MAATYQSTIAMSVVSRSERDFIATALEDIKGHALEITDQTRIVEDLGLDSLAVMNFIMAVEDRYDVSISLDRVAQLQTVGDLLAALTELRKGD